MFMSKKSFIHKHVKFTISDLTDYCNRHFERFLSNTYPQYREQAIQILYLAPLDKRQNILNCFETWVWLQLQQCLLNNLLQLRELIARSLVKLMSFTHTTTQQSYNNL